MLTVLLLAALSGGASAQGQPGARVAGPGQGERRVALVIGVTQYERPGFPRLQGTVNDARQMGALLRSRGFTLATGAAVENPNKAQFEAAIRDFVTAAMDADVAVFYFSGHGMQGLGRNWMAPRDAEIHREGDAPLALIDVELVVQQMAAARVKLGILIFDACRNNPYNPPGLVREARSGLLPMQAPPGMLIAFATDPGNTSADGSAGENSLYTLHLMRAMQQPGLDLLRMFNRAAIETRRASIEIATRRGETRAAQTPWLAVSPIERDFYFTPADGQVAAQIPPAAPPVQAATPPATPAAQPAGGDPSFNLINFSGRRITLVQAALATAGDLGENRLGPTAMQVGQRLLVNLPTGQGCQVNLRLQLEGMAQPIENRQVDTCSLWTLVIPISGQVVPANPDFTLVNRTGRTLTDIRASLGVDTEWGDNRLPAGQRLAPGGQLQINLRHGIDCAVDIRVRSEGAPDIERHGLQLGTETTYAIQ